MQFSGVIGQSSLKKQLISDYQKNKISHAQLFSGEAGFGGLPLILAYVQYLFCENKTETDSCGKCPSCKKVAMLQHPDLHFSFPVVQGISKTSDGLINEWREIVLNHPYFDLNQWLNFIDPKGRKPIIGSEESLQIIKKLSLKSYEGGYKVMVIWMAEEMNPTCANKLLKILEEPHPKTLFFLLAEKTDLILPTIISRTRITKVHRIAVDEVIEYLSKGAGITSSQAQDIAVQSEGNLIAALKVLSNNEDRSFNREQFIQFMRACYKKDVNEMISWSEQMAEQGRDKQKQFLAYSLQMFRQSLLKNYMKDQLVNITAEEEKFLANFARFITNNNVMDFMEHFNNAHYYVERNANSKILFTNLAFKVMRYIHVA